MTWKLRMSTQHFRCEVVLLIFLFLQNACQGETVSHDGWSQWSQWESCSAPCEYGTSTRTRQCLRKDSSDGQDLRALQVNHTACNGASVQVKVCKLKACPPDQKSPHQEACSQYDSRMFSGKQYAWEPFIHANDACKLSCRAKGVHFYANLPDKADDGIPCKLGMAEAACIKGVCKRVGCDGIVESGATKDNCGVCGGDGSSCQTISGIFTSTSLKRGLNYVISMPAGSTNINITELQASRNLLVLQTEMGKTFINENTTSPVSAVVEAAGTSFTYGAKSASSPKEIIISSGPTNMSVILKLLVRGSNPSIMYTFSVPKAVSEAVIQQIRRHSQPVELPPEPHDNRHAQFQLSNRRQQAFQRLAARRTTKAGHQMSSASIGDTTLLEFSSTQPSVIVDDHSHFPNEDTDDGKPPDSDGQTHLSRDVGLDNGAEPDQASIVGSVDTSSTHGYWISEQITEMSTAHPTTVQEAKPMDNIIKDEDNWDYSSVFSEITNPPHTEFITEVYENYKEDNNKRNTSTLLVSTTSSVQSPEKTEISNMVDNFEELGKSEHSGGYKKHGENEDRQPVGELRDQKVPDSSLSRKGNSEAGNFEDTLRSKTNIPPYLDEITDFSPKPTQESAVNTHDYSNVTHYNVSRKPQLVNYNDSFDKHLSSSSSPPKGRLRYKIPRYSQSFTFVERYKDTYHRNRTNSRNHTSRSRQHAHRRHRHHQQSSLNLPGHGSYNDSSHMSDHKTHSSHNKNTALERNTGRNTYDRRDYEDNDDELERVEDTEREQSISEFGTMPHSNRNSQHGPSEMQHSNGDEQVSREMRLRDRHVLMEERRRRMEQQRQQYNERLREYQERLRQRQNAIDESRRRNSYAAPRVTSEENINNRNIPQPETISSSSSSSSHGAFNASQHSGRSSFVDGNAQSSQSRFTDSNKDSRGYNTGHNSNFQRQEQVQQRPREYPNTETSNRRHTSLLPNRDNNNAYGNSQLPGGYNSGNQQWRESSRGQEAPFSVPFVKQPPRQEYPDSLDGGGENSHGQHNSPRATSLGPRYIPGYRAALQSAVNEPETPNGQTVISSSRQQTGTGQVGPDSQSNQIPFETVHNTPMAIYEWRISGLTECTHSCGGGVQQTVVVCVDTVTQAVVTDDNCRHLPRPDQLAMPCNTRPCSAAWTPGPWSSCSVTCGNGEQTRIVTCQARVSPTLNLTMPSSSCEGQERISNRQSCANKPCSSWSVGVWSNCSTPCGDGKKTRDVQCIDLDKNVISDDACSDMKPDSEESCNLGECGKGWFFTEWTSECPAECGAGELTRQVFCADDTGSALPDSRCNINQRPAVSQPCRVSRPCGGLWFTGEWLQCDSKCGEGNRHREVLCIKELSGSVHAVVGEENCEGSEKPAVTEPCQGPPCTSEWYMTSWSQCSQSCGTGYRSREVKCLDSEQKLQDDCPVTTKPKTRDACNIHSCDHIEDKNSEEDPSCTDKFAQCKVVKRARLCRYDYYKTVCCKSCSAET